MANPRIVPGRAGSTTEFGVRGHVLGETFQIFVRVDSLGPHDRLAVEDCLIEEARSIIRKAEKAGNFDWERYGFRRSEAFASLERTLSAKEVDHLARG